MLILRFLLHIIRVLITRDIQVEGLWTIRHRIIITTETITVAIIIITEIMETTETMVVLLIVVSAILGFVIIYNLGILSFTEKQYQFATLKVLGFKDKQIKNIFVKQNLWLTVAGIVIGLPLGFWMLDYIFKSALGENYDFNAYINLVSYLYATVGSLVVSVVVNKVLSRKVKKIDMVSSLKGNE